MWRNNLRESQQKADYHIIQNMSYLVHKIVSHAKDSMI